MDETNSTAKKTKKKMNTSFNLIIEKLRRGKFDAAANDAESRFGDSRTSIFEMGTLDINELLAEARNESREVAATFEEKAIELSTEDIPSQEEHQKRMKVVSKLVDDIQEASFTQLQDICKRIVNSENF